MPFVGRTGWAAPPTHTLKLTFADTQNHALWVLMKAGTRLERAEGIEPSYAAWEAAVLPLNYARIGVRDDVAETVRSAKPLPSNNRPGDARARRRRQAWPTGFAAAGDFPDDGSSSDVIIRSDGWARIHDL
jgi:hypothetical protein